jgi:predicted glycoside hydrolase/deacetylase ChbG (UPF0249 family)
MLIINADDWGRSPQETDLALACHRAGRITSVSAMVFMADSARAAALARENRVDVGLHLNLSQLYDAPAVPEAARQSQAQLVHFMTKSKYALLVYHPGLRRHFQRVIRDQLEEFTRLYGQAPTHVDGHQHRHLAANVVFGNLLPKGQRVRRNFSFWPGEKSALNRAYRWGVDRWLAGRYRLADYFFSLEDCLRWNRFERVFQLAAKVKVELMTHPAHGDEYTWLMSDAGKTSLQRLELAPYARM